MRRATFLSLSIFLLGATIVASLAGAATRDRRFFSARYGVGIDAPTGWAVSQHTGYPSILVLLLHPNGSRISVSAAATPAADARALAEQNRRALEVQHLSITKSAPGARNGVLVEARNTRGDELRQLYIVRALPNNTRQAVVVTLVAKTDALAAAEPGFEWAVAHLALEAPTGTDEVTPDAGASAVEHGGGNHDGGSAAEHATGPGHR